MIDRAALERDGCGIIRGVVPASLIDRARSETDLVAAAGTRQPLAQYPSLSDIAGCPSIRSIVELLLGETAVLTRSILFDKTAEHNWPVAPHRDTTIAVSERHDVEGYGPWSIKEGVHHARPPDEILARMWTLRVALDPAGPANGPLKIQLGSHAEDTPTGEWETFTTEPGDVVLMRRFAMHASDRSREPSRRRVLHLEWAAGPLPPPLMWA